MGKSQAKLQVLATYNEGGMSEKLEELPLFPLETVLFPYAALQLHVFEERYRDMVRDCMSSDKPFGIVLIRSGDMTGGSAEPYMVGTAVRIVQVYTYEDGRLDIQVQGERRFRIRKIDESKPYLVGWVEPVIELDVCWIAGRGLEPEWPIHHGYTMEALGNPNVRTRVSFSPSRQNAGLADHLDLSNTITAMPVVAAIPTVHAAPPGIRTYADLPLITGRWAPGS